MFIIGITGPTGAGKTIAAGALDEHGALSLDCDDIYHDLSEHDTDMINEIAMRFPEASSGNSIDRKILAGIVFRDGAALEALNKITHKYVLAEVKRRIRKFEKSGGSIVLISAIALIESGYSTECNAVVSIIAPADIRLSRLSARDGLSREQIQDRMNSQPSDEFYKNNSDYTLENTCDNPDEFRSICKKFFLSICGSRVQ